MPLSPWWKPWARRRSEASPASVSPSPVADEPAAESTAGSGNGVADTGPTMSVAEHLRFVCWLLGEPAPTKAAPQPPSKRIAPLLEHVDAVIASETLRAALLPRAPHVVPQLMKSLRYDSYSSADVAARISKDVALTTEVIRSAAAKTDRGDDAGELDLGWAVSAIGTEGLRRAIAKVVLRPMFDARGDTLSARAAQQIWKDADRKARHCTTIATDELLDPLDGYLVGLLHDTGWTALLRAIDNLPGSAVTVADLCHPAVVPELIRRRDTLFGALVQPWNLGPAINVLAVEVAFKGLGAAETPLGIALRQADRLAALDAIKR